MVHLGGYENKSGRRDESDWETAIGFLVLKGNIHTNIPYLVQIFELPQTRIRFAARDMALRGFMLKIKRFVRSYMYSGITTMFIHAPCGDILSSTRTTSRACTHVRVKSSLCVHMNTQYNEPVAGW